MTTVQESTNGHRVSPPPSSFPDSQQENRSEDSPNNNNSQFAQQGNGVVERQNGVPITPLLAHEKVTETFPANAYHVPPQRYAPKADFRRQELPSVEIDTNPLPERCQFMFSDGRQCSMGRSDIHPSLCRFHSEREGQLFGDPTAGGKVVGAALDLPELYSACRDLTTTAGVNRALAQVFRLLAQHRISRQEAATFGHLAQLLLRTISLARTEHAAASENEQPMIPVVERQKGVSSRESHGDQELSRVIKSTPLLPHEKLVPSKVPEREYSPEPTPAIGIKPKPTQMNTSAGSTSNSPEINTSEIAGLKLAQNQHLQKNSGDNPISESSSIKLGRTGSEGAERVPDNHENRRKT